MEALSFSNTFKSPDAEEKAKRQNEEIQEILNGVKKQVNPDGTWIIRDNLEIYGLRSVTDLKFLSNINSVDGDLSIIGFHNLISLEGCPQRIGGTFQVKDTEITSLKGGPVQVGKNYDCFNNRLASLKGAPVRISGDFDCSYNPLESLEGCPKYVGGTFYLIRSFLSIDKDIEVFTKQDIKVVCNVKTVYIH